MTSPLLEKHRATLDGALGALATRGFWSAYPEAPSGKIYGETAAADGKAAFDALKGKPFPLAQPGTKGRIGAERSPYGFALGITYPQADLDTLVEAASAARAGWRRAGAPARVGVCLEILHRLNRRSFEIAQAVMHTTGQGFVMAFQAGGPHAQDRGLEAVALAFDAMTRVPASARWEKPQGRGEPLRVDKRWHVVPRGLGLVIGVSTFPTWNSYPGLFANLATGNPTIVKPHPAAVLPLALTVKIAREVLAEAGFDPDVVLLAADTQDAPIAQALAVRPEIALIDYTGGPAFGAWLRANAGHATLFAEEAGVNPVVIDSTADFRGLCGNLAFSLALYAGQMCTTPQTIFVPESGIATDQGRKSFGEVAGAIADAVARLLADPARAAEILGAIRSPATLARLEAAAKHGNVVLASRALVHPQFPDATLRTPLIVEPPAARRDVWGAECFGPISFVVPTADTAESLRIAFDTARAKGAITASLHSTDPGVIAVAEDAAAGAGVGLAVNFTGGLFVNQSAAFSDFHASGCNPASNASLSDAGFVTPRFHFVQTRVPVA